jgi:hypothetical protein
MSDIADPKMKTLNVDPAKLLLWGGLVACAVGALALVGLALIKVSYSHEHAWGSLHSVIIARNFADHGLFGLRGLPIQNNDPLTSELDTYLHWPPLFYYVLGGWIAIFGDSARSVQFFMVMGVFATAATLGLIVRQFGSLAQAVFCAAAFMLMPATVRFGIAPHPVNLALLLVALALLLAAGLLRDDGRPSDRPRAMLFLSSVIFFFAIMASWEAVLALPGLFVAWLIRRDARIFWVLFWWSVACGLSLATVAGLYAASDETFLQEIWNTFLLRAGIVDYAAAHPARIHLLEPELESTITLRRMAEVALRIPEFIHAIAIMGLCTLLFAILGLGTRRLGSFATVAVLAFASIWLGWAVLMKQHFTAHNYQLLIASPLLAIGISVLMAWLADDGARPIPRGLHFRHLLAGVALPIALISAAVSPFLTYLRWNEPLIAFGREIRDNVPQNALVLTDQISSVVLYYSDRHVLRGMQDEQQVRQGMSDFRRLCTDCPLYMAIPPESVPKFNGLVSGSASTRRGENAVIVPLH